MSLIKLGCVMYKIQYLIIILLICHQQTYANNTPTTEPDKNFNLTKIPTKPQSPINTTAPTPNELPSISSDELINNPELLEHALYSSVVLGNIQAVDKLLPLYKQLPNVKNDSASLLLIQMSEALLAQSKGNLKKAIKLYRTILSNNPQISDIRFLLAQTLLADQQNEAAKDQLLRLRSESELSEDEHLTINQLLALINKRSVWEFSGGFSYAYDPNINNAPDKRSVDMHGGTWTFNNPESAHGVSYFANIGKDWNLKNNYYAHFSTDVTGKSYWTNHDYDDLILQNKLGIKYKNARTEFAILPYYQKRWSANDPYTQEIGIAGEWSHWLTSKHQLLTAASTGKETYTHNNKASGTTINGSATWLFVNNTRQYWTLGSDYAYKDAKDKSHAYNRLGARASWTQEWQKGISTSLAIDIARRNYQGADIFNIVRKDNEYMGRVSIWHRNIHFWGITPRLTLSHRITNSNHPAYKYSKSGTIIQLNKRF